MAGTPKTISDLAEAIRPHIAFDGWSDAGFQAAARDTGLSIAEAHALAPRGAVDLAVALHRQGDQQFTEAFAAHDLSDLRYSEKVAEAVSLRIAFAGDRDLVRRSAGLFALPGHVGEGAALVWGTADAIWTALGDTSRDGNWYSKRAILSGVYSASLLFWLGDTGNGDDTRAFIDRRVANVMQFEKLKGRVRASRPLGPLGALADRLMAGVAAPRSGPRTDLPGYIGQRNDA